tara:strand:- start:310 stop:978 length:669 start_codon:yes stop_codon:yes gene_type:complete
MSNTEQGGKIAGKLNDMKPIDINNLTPQDIKKVMLGLGMKVFTKPYDMTKGAIRTADNHSGKFNDWLFMIYHDDKGVLQGEIVEGTTDAGLYYRTHPMHPDGTAIIQHSKQYPLSHTYMETNGHRGEEAFRQTGLMDYFRDPNYDEYLDFVNPESGKNHATNEHNMGTLGDDVHTWSAGCSGTVKKLMRKLYNLAKLQIKHGLGAKFSYAMLHENDFENQTK